MQLLRLLEAPFVVKLYNMKLHQSSKNHFSFQIPHFTVEHCSKKVAFSNQIIKNLIFFQLKWLLLAGSF
jgi:hypothetical protein